MAVEGINNSVVSQSQFETSPIAQAAATSTTDNQSVDSNVAARSADVTVTISPAAQQLAQDNVIATTVSQSSATESSADAATASQFGVNSTANNASVAVEVNGSSGNTLNAAPSNSSQSGSVASQYNISPDSALGQTINFSA